MFGSTVTSDSLRVLNEGKYDAVPRYYAAIRGLIAGHSH